MVAKSSPVKSAAAQALAAMTREYLVEVGEDSPSTSPWTRKPCAYGACNQTFSPNGHGPLHHTSCPVASQFWGMLQKARKASEAEYEAKILVAKTFADRLAEQRKAAAAAKAAAEAAN